MTVSFTGNFLTNARGLTFADGGGATWTLNPNTNTVSLTISGTGLTPGSVTNSDLANMAGNTIKGNNTAGAAAPVDMTVGQTKTLLSLNLVENTTLSTWSGSANVVTLGTIVTGVWNGTAIASANIGSVLTGKTYNGLTLTAASVGFTIAGGTIPETLTVNGNATVSGTNTGDQTLPTAANPTGTIGLAAVNGAAATFSRSDSAPALSQAITPTWTGAHNHTGGLAVNGGPVYSGFPLFTVASAYTLVLADANTHQSANTGTTGSVTIPANSVVAFPLGTCVKISNFSGVAISISINTDTLIFSPSGASGTRSLAHKGICFIDKVQGTTWVIYGFGLT